MVEKALKFRFYPTPEQEDLLRRTLGCVRLVYNKALAARTEAWYKQKERVGYSQTSSMLTEWKKEEELDFLNEVSSVPLQQSLRHLQTAFTNFFAGRTKYPNFKKKRLGGSAEFSKAAFKWRDGQVYIAKCFEPLPIRWSRQLPKGCSPSTITVKLDPSSRWFVSLRIDDPVDHKLKPIDKKVGIDLGITSLFTTSDGVKVSNPKHFDKLYKKLRLAQKSLSRKIKGSKNRERARVKVARIQAKIADCRRDKTHKLTTQLIRENQTIAVEDLAVKNMVKNHKLARAISDANWGELVRQLTYKAEWYGRELIKIDRWFPSSKRCSNCGYIAEKMPLNIREWDCPKCNSHHDRDINASINILAAGLAVSVCGATVRAEQNKSVKPGAKSSSLKRKKQKPKL
ncbi:RNA-guided endonuclease TnpB family protein [Limnoraphis robusta Tam1]|uniref:Transposase n=2 Tax=Limnoraphis robusta TaxID=1118279 RepID=A0A0F5YI39_9CYAN|nr:RNA-guided endonuclease TnpB family protein [Limnoraphis robusta]KKD38554.1 transposase [Limnoraphis robusta CS-951]MEA5522077.1 RNA-guided endonuclease TnpB family protein [Limnoraphis robusta CCNP1315]MEA5538583.1 RNA-guided endonuclease TnpB family protein [Limnoraphis robusta Tam1]MEA5545520.1 RNA-guided endonuclease TnpB family protein [Limnoraphis robusta CCNP1324]